MSFENFIDIFTKSIAAIFAIAFLSLAPQLKALFAENGISPIKRNRDSMKELLVNPQLKTASLFWLNAEDWFLVASCHFGATLALAVAVFDFYPTISLLVLYILYQSFTSLGFPFMSFQWDILLLEAGFLSFLLHFAYDFDLNFASMLIFFLLLTLIFKLMLLSGLAKIASGDKNWTELKALNYHYYTQPLANPLSIFFHNAPNWFHKLSVLLMFFISIGLPLLVFMGPGPAKVAGLGFIGLMALIAVSGNYCFFNVLAIILCLPLFCNDWAWMQLANYKALFKLSLHSVFDFTFLAFSIIYLLTSLIYILKVTPKAFNLYQKLYNLFSPVMDYLQYLHLNNSYGLFAAMTTRRIEIIIQGSDDEKTWLDYEFHWKPGNTKRIPGQAAPYQPRLDWQMWFAALGTYEKNPWIVDLAAKLLLGEKEVLKLFKTNPFKEQPPKYIRALSYDYKFSDLKTLFETGEIWQRELKGQYLPHVSLSQ